jgi:hypothetical protein
MQRERIGISITLKPSNAAPFAPRQIKNCDRQPHFSHRHIADGLRQDESHRHWAFRHESSRDNPQPSSFSPRLGGALIKLVVRCRLCLRIGFPLGLSGHR